METKKIQFLISMFFLFGYFMLITFIIYAEVSDSMNMVKGKNSLIGEVKILVGVLTGAIAQILNFWFNKNSNNQNEIIDIVKQLNKKDS